jgi:ribosomal protein S18 acetylase RimI-like enzyme
VTPTHALSPTLTYRRIDPAADAALAARHHFEACVASFGDESRYEGREKYLAWLKRQVEQYPDGCVLAFEKDRCVGQMEMQVPYGLAVGYVNLFYVTPEFRGRGYGTLLHQYADRYFRSWEARRIELHVSPTNERAVGFYRKMGYRFIAADEAPMTRLWKMAKVLGEER